MRSISCCQGDRLSLGCFLAATGATGMTGVMRPTGVTGMASLTGMMGGIV